MRVATRPVVSWIVKMIFTACAICNRSFTRDSPRWCCAVCDTNDDTASRSDLREAVAVLEDVERRGRRVYADDEYETETITGALREARQKLVNAERTDAIANVDRLRDELAAAEVALAAMRSS